MLIEEETHIEFDNYDQLSYFDDDLDTVALYIDKEFVGDIKVWKDSEMEDREYICLNYEIIYLDTLKKF